MSNVVLSLPHCERCCTMFFSSRFFTHLRGLSLRMGATKSWKIPLSITLNSQIPVWQLSSKTHNFSGPWFGNNNFRDRDGNEVTSPGKIHWHTALGWHLENTVICRQLTPVNSMCMCMCVSGGKYLWTYAGSEGVKFWVAPPTHHQDLGCWWFLAHSPR